MVQFAKKLQNVIFNPWKEYYLDYKLLKKVLKTDEAGDDTSTKDDNVALSQSSGNYYQNEAFRQVLDREIEKVIMFFLRQQGEFASQLVELRERSFTLVSQPPLESEDTKADNYIHDTLDEIEVLSSNYRQIGADLVTFVKFIELNATGLRKILKKHDKKYTRKLTNLYVKHYSVKDTDTHLQQLYHYEGIAALVTTIRQGLRELRDLKRRLKEVKFSSEMHTIDRLNNTDVDGKWSNQESIHSTVSHSEYSSIDVKSKGKTYTIYYRTNYSSVENSDDDESYCEDTLDPILEQIEHARKQLHQSTLYVEALAAQALFFEDGSDSEGELRPTKRTKDTKEIRKVRISSFLNLTSTFLYMTNYYIVAPTSGQYAEKLGSTQALSGVLIGMTPCAALVSAVLYSWWANRSYKSAFFCASACSMLGNIFYAFALSCNSLNMVIIGRILNGFGGARAINRRFIADVYSREERTVASAAFVTAGALGMSAGPAIAASVGSFQVAPDNVLWTHETAPGWIMFCLWLFYFVSTFFFFEEPKRTDTKVPVKGKVELPTTTNSQDAMAISNEKTPILPTVVITNHSEKKSKPLYTNTPVVVTLVIYFVLKLVLECLLSSAPTLTSYYFNWQSVSSGSFLAILGFLMFPANLFVANLSSKFEDREIIYFTLWFVLVGTFGILSYEFDPEMYSEIQYIVFAICIFLSTNILESANMSLLSKTVPRSLARGTFNSGLLATEAGTLGRAFGDIFISIAGLVGNKIGPEYVLDCIFCPLGIVVLITIYVTWKSYRNLLEPSDDDDDF